MSNTPGWWVDPSDLEWELDGTPKKAIMIKRLRENVKIISLMPLTSDVYGCYPCEVYWIDGPECWSCGEQGILLATAQTKPQMVKDAHRAT